MIAVAAVFIQGKLHSGSSDPGCQAYANTALPAYNKAVSVLQQPGRESTLSAEMTTAVNDLAARPGRRSPRRPSPPSAPCSPELDDRAADVASGSVPTAVVNALNADSAQADSVCS